MKNNKPQIVQVVSYFPPHLGGMENAVLEITNKLSESKYKVSVYTSDIGIKRSLKNVRNFKVNYLSSIEIAHTPIIFSLFFKLVSLSENSLIHLHISQAYTPEVVYLVSKIKKIPYIAHIHLDVDASGKFGFLLKPYKKYFLSRVLKNASKIICLSEDQKKFIAKKYNLPLSSIVVIPNGVGKEFFIKKSNNINKIPHLLFVGRLAKQKNVTVLINAVTFMKNKVYLDIVGSGEEEKSLKKKIVELKLKNVKLHGKKTEKELIDIYKTSDVFVIASEKEGISLSMLEALAAGLPIVGADVVGIKDLIKDVGILVSNPTPINFAKALDNLLSNKSEIKRFSNLSVAKAKNYSWDKIISKIETVYKEVGYENK